MRVRTFLVSSVAALLLGACGGGEPQAGPPEIEEAERRLGAEQHPQLLAEFGGAYAGPEAAYLRQMGEKMAEAAQLGGQCTFTLVNTDVVNAFAVPGCYIYVTRGMMGIVNSEAELASVLGHELGHIVADHSERQQKRSIWRTLGVAAISLVTGSESLTRIAGEAAQYFTLRYSRKQEFESDDLGIRYLRTAGYDPHAAADMLAALSRQEQYMLRSRDRDDANAIPEWARTHPLTENRIERARGTASQTGAEPGTLPENEEAYLREVDGLLYGDDPQQGFVIGRRFAHPVMRIAFEAPQGFTLTNSPQAVMIEGPDGLRGEFGGSRLGRGGLEGYVDHIFEQLLGNARVELGTAQRARIGGLPALIVPAIVRTEQGAVQFTVAAYEAPGGAAYHFIMASPATGGGAEALDRLFGSFRLIGAEEAASLRPRRLRVVAAGPRDTLQTLASRMAADQPLELFLMLNARTRKEPLTAGERVKIVAFSAN